MCLRRAIFVLIFIFCKIRSSEFVECSFRERFRNSLTWGMNLSLVLWSDSILRHKPGSYNQHSAADKKVIGRRTLTYNLHVFIWKGLVGVDFIHEKGKISNWRIILYQNITIFDKIRSTWIMSVEGGNKINIFIFSSIDNDSSCSFYSLCQWNPICHHNLNATLTCVHPPHPSCRSLVYK